jgi:hypothetical protein
MVSLARQELNQLSRNEHPAPFHRWQASYFTSVALANAELLWLVRVSNLFVQAAACEHAQLDH